MAFINHMMQDQVYLLPVVRQGIYFLRVVRIGVEYIQDIVHDDLAFTACKVILDLLLTKVTAHAGLFLVLSEIFEQYCAAATGLTCDILHHAYCHAAYGWFNSDSSE